MIVNPDKHHAMVLGTTDHKFSFPVEDSLDMLGVTIDNHLNFNKHVSLDYAYLMTVVSIYM